MNISFSETFKKVTSVALIFGIVFSTLTPAAFAATSLFSDSFGSAGNSVVTGWSEIESGSSDAALSTSDPRSGSSTTGQARVRDGASITQTVVTTGYSNIKLRYYWRGDDNGDESSGNTDTLDVYWKKSSDSTFILLNSYLMDGNAVWSSQVTTTLPSTADNTSIDIRFVGNSNNDNEEGRIDDVSVEGDTVPSDTTAPVISQVTAVPSPTADTTPNYTFTTDEAGTISYTGDCSSSTTSAVVGSNTITFNTLAAGVHSNCTVRVTDSSSNASNILNVNSFTVDTAAPLLSLPSNITQEATSNSGATVNFSATSTDVDPASPTVTCNPASGTTFPITTTTVNCSATDTVGNVSNGSFTVTIQDTTKPVITINGGTVNLNVGDTYIEQGATATDTVDGDLTASIITAGSVNTAAPGVYTITYNVTDAHGNAATTVSRTVNVSDVTAPVISGVPSDIVVEQVGNAAVTVNYTNPTANDDVDGSVSVLCSPTSGSAFSYGLTAVLCNATDLASNVANASFNVTVQDTIAPTATSVAIISDNTNTGLAKEGNTITVSFTTSEPVNTPTATIAGKTATVTNTSGNDYTATYTLTAAETQGVASLAIDFTDIAGNSATQVTATTDSSSVTIDTVSPTPFMVMRPSDNEVIESATTNSEGSCETGATISISGTALQTNPTTTTCVGGQFLTPITFTATSLDTAFNLTFTQTDAAGNTNVKTINNIQYKTKVISTGGSGPANTDFVDNNNTPTPTPNPTPAPAPTPTPTPTQIPPTNTNPQQPTPTPENTPTTPTDTTTPENPETPVDNNNTPTPTPNPTPAPAPTEGTTGGGTTGGNTAPAFNPADATLDIGGAGNPEAEPVSEEVAPVEGVNDAGGGVVPEENSYTLLWTLLGLIALLNTWWFFVAKNKTPTVHRRD